MSRSGSAVTDEPQPPAPHPASIAVWAVPSPVAVGTRFTVMVGVKCASGCRLTGLPIVVRDAAGAIVGRGRLGETPSPGTRALYAAEVALEAPEVEGVHSRCANFAGGAPAGEMEAAGACPEAAHAAAASTFSFRTTAPPDHRVTVTVRERETESPVARAEVRLGLYRAATDARGQAVLDVPRGEYDVSVRKAGYEPHAGRVIVAGDIALRIDAVPASDADADDDRLWM